MPGTLISFLEKLKHDSNKGITFIEGAGQEYFLSYRELFSKALFVLHHYQQRGISSGDEVIFQVEENRDFVIQFWACLLGGIIPVPVSVGNQPDYKHKLFAIWNRLSKGYLLCDEQHLQRLEQYLEGIGEQNKFSEIKERTLFLSSMRESAVAGSPVDAHPDSIAYIQFSSGSTGDPKGVILTHSNLLCNTTDIGERSVITDNDRMLSWMPLTHDMGLICFHLTGIRMGIQQYIMPTILFIRRPALWIEKANEHGVSLLYSPNFGYEYFLSSIAGKTYEWDLSAIRLIYNGAEPISLSLIQRFLEAMAVYRMQPTCMFPGYGLAEASVAVTLPVPGDPLRYYYLKRDKLSLFDKVEMQVDDGDRSEYVSFVDVGYPIRQCRVRICDNNDRMLDDDCIGHIQIQGGNVSAGYYNDPAASAKLFSADGWVKTGDLGFIHEGRLVITGRLKNIIIINGQNYYPHDIERIAMQVPGISTGTIVACGSKDPLAAQESLLLFILFKGTNSDFLPLYKAVRDRIAGELGLAAEKIIPVKKIPKTTSGKIRNFKLLEQYNNGAYDTALTELNDLLQDDAVQYSNQDIPGMLCAVWKETAANREITYTEDFFKAGINSILLTRFISRINRALSIELSVSDVFTNPTLAALENCIREKMVKKLPAIPVATARAWDELSLNQQRFFLFDKYQEVRGVYNISLAFQLLGELNIAALERAITIIAGRHTILRTVFSTREDVPVQLVREQAPTGLLITDLRYTEGREKIIQEISAEEADYPFVLEEGPLVRFRLVQCNEQENIFFFTIHHIIADGWSAGVLFKELRILYNQLIAGGAPELPALNIQFTDCMYWQKERLQPSLDAHKQYWQQELAGLQPLQLPSRKLRPHYKTYTGNVCAYTIDKLLTEKLNTLSRNSGVTLFITLLSAVNVVLSKYSGQDDIITGTDAAGREHPDLEDQVGCYSNAIPVRVKVDAQNSFESLLHHVKEKFIKAFDRQQYPFSQLVDDLGLIHDTSRSPVFDVLILLQNFSDRKLQLSPGIEVSALLQPCSTSFMDMQVEFIEGEGIIELFVRYNTDIYEEEQVEGMIQYFVRLAEMVTENPGISIAAADGMSLAEREQLLSVYNKADDPVVYTETVVQFFSKQVLRTPDAIAVSTADCGLSYRMLDLQANSLAAYIQQEYTIIRGDKIGIYITRNEQMVVAMLGIMKAGAAYVPLDTELPPERLNYIIADSGIRFIITDEENTKGKEFKVPVLIAATAIAQQGQVTVVDVQPSDLAYLMYTSGTTGKPKGVLISHLSLIDYVQSFSQYFNVAADDVVLQQASPAFDTSIEEIFPALCCGARVHILKDGGRDISGLFSAIEKNGITILSSTPLVINELNSQFKSLHAVRAIISGGDVLRPSHVDRLFDKAAIYNTYGPTESTVCALYHKINNPAEAGLLGKPVNNKKVYILDNDLNLVPEGVTGEICISGPGLAIGYHNKEEETGQRFVSNPFNPGTRLYHTGDYGKWLRGGIVEFAGRKDAQVKINGYRVETGDVEAAIHKLADGCDVLVIAGEMTPGINVLTAYIISKNIFDLVILRKQLLEVLPNYMVPAFFFALEEFPLLPNGKINYGALPQPAASERDGDGQYREAGNITEALLVQIWENAFGLEKIGTRDNFFALGGHSIRAIQIMTQISRGFKTSISLQEFFTYQTIELLALHITSKKNTGFIPIPVSDRLEDYTLSSAQKRMWFLYQMDKGNIFHNLSWIYHFEGDIDISALQKAIKSLAEKHEVLRTTFVVSNGDPRQKLHAVPFTLFEYKDDRSRQHSLAEVQLIAQAELDKPYDLEKGPLIRTRLIHYKENAFLFLLGMHHIITDAWSMDIIAADLVSNYNLYKKKADSASVPGRIQYKDYAAWQNDLVHKNEMASHKAYWVRKMGGDLPILNFPADFPRKTDRTFKGRKITAALSEQGTKQLFTATVTNKTSEFTVLLALVKLLIYKYTGDTDIIAGIPVAGRDHPDLENIAGCFINIIPLRTCINENETLKSLIELVKQNTLEAYEHQAYPFDSIIRDVNPRREPGHSPLFDIMVSFRTGNSTPDMRMELQGVTVTPIEKQVTASEYDISIEFKREAGLLSMCVEYSEELFHGKRIQRLVNHFQHILERLDTLNPQPLSAISLLGKEEEILLGYTFSNAGFPAIPYKSIAGMFEAAVQQFADKTAIVMQDEAFTYRQINERSNQLAHLFRNKYGILAEGRIGIMMARSAEQIIVMLAVIKAGAAFVPLEPGLPLDRIEYILRDSDLELLVTDNDEHKFTFLTKDKILHISASGWPAADYPAYNPGIRPVLSQLAYIIYTSGSTGLPKGVMIEYGSLERYVCQFIDFFSISAADVIIHQSSISFDLSIEEIFPALSTGGKVVIIKDGGMDIAAIISSIHKEQVSVISITPMILNELNKTDYQQLKSLRAIICGGDKIQAGQLNRLLDKTAIYNTYGPTESTVCATYHKIESLNGLDIIGKPLVNREVFIVDSNMNLEPIGIPGEICIGGDGLARGYLNQQDLTNRSFISNKSGKGRLFRTGDTGYWNEEGCIVFTGRNDYQVKIRGYRVETGEIESRLHQLEGVISCVVSVYQNEKQINQLIAYVVSNSKTKDDIRDYLGKYLPAYMVPAYIMLVDKIPQTVTGKADRKALPAPETGRGTTEIQAMAPRNDTEEKLTVIWEKALERNGIGMTDNFFEIGGHSLSAMRIIAEIAAMFAVKIELRSLFQYPTIAGLARLIISGREQSYQKIVKVREQDYYPASAAQQRLWIVDQVDEKRIAYNMVAAYKLKGPLKKDIVEKTLFALVDRHESLRTTFIMTGGQLQQRISSLHESGARLCFTDFTGQDNIDGCTEEYLVKEINTPFDLETGPLLRASLLQTGEDMFVIVFSIHHIISDGRSSVILINEFISLYNSECTRGEAALPWLAIQYKDYSAWQLSRMQDKEMIEHAGYWKHQLQEPLPVLNMVTDFPRPAVRTYQGKTMKFMLDESLAERVKGLGYQYDVSLFITLLSMATVFLHKYTGQDDIITGVPVSGRTDKDTEGIVGFFVNSLPVRTRFRITDSFEDILLQVKESVLAGYAHQDYPFDLMVEELSSKAEKGRSPVFDIMVLLENNGGNEKKFADMDGVEVFDVELPDMTSKFDLTFNFIENGPGISLHISYDTALFKEVSIMLLFRKFIQLAGRLVQNAGVALTDVDITTAEENELAQSLFDIPFNIDG